MVRIRLVRTGRTHQAHFRVVVIPQREKMNSSVIEYVGHYSPHSKELVLEKERIEYWLSKGAQPSDTVKRMLIKQGILKAPKAKANFQKQPGKKKTERLEAQKAKEAAERAAKEAAKAQKAAEVVEEAPTA